MIRAHCDTRGRVYLRESIRERLGKEFLLLEVEGGILLIAAPKDPVADLARLGKRLEGVDIEKIKDRIAGKAKREALE